MGRVRNPLRNHLIPSDLRLRRVLLRASPAAIGLGVSSGFQSSTASQGYPLTFGTPGQHGRCPAAGVAPPRGSARSPSEYSAPKRGGRHTG